MCDCVLLCTMPTGPEDSTFEFKFQLAEAKMLGTKLGFSAKQQASKPFYL